MKKALILAAAAISLTALQAVSAEDYRITGGLIDLAEGDKHLFINGAYQVNDYISATARYELGDYKGVTVKGGLVGAELGRKFHDSVTSYVSAGYGYYHTNSISGETAYYGSGLRYHGGSVFIVELEHRYLYHFETNATSLAFGVEF